MWPVTIGVAHLGGRVALLQMIKHPMIKANDARFTSPRHLAVPEASVVIATPNIRGGSRLSY
ncbi:unnamed protein product, partial [Nesidiocoris tenuis]